VETGIFREMFGYSKRYLRTSYAKRNISAAGIIVEITVPNARFHRCRLNCFRKVLERACAAPHRATACSLNKLVFCRCGNGRSSRSFIENLGHQEYRINRVVSDRPNRKLDRGYCPHECTDNSVVYSIFNSTACWSWSLSSIPIHFGGCINTATIA